jgi:hypothetical protein
MTGYGHLLFLLGVIFFVRRQRDVAIYITLFTLGGFDTPRCDPYAPE